MGKDVKVAIKNLDDMERFANKVARKLRGGEILGLIGDLGAGKTAFVQALAKAMGISKKVRSPTFVLMQCFDTSKDYSTKFGINELCHADAYRLKTVDELFAIGFGEYIDREDAITVVEWVNRVESIGWLEDYREIKFVFGEGEERILTHDWRLA